MTEYPDFIPTVDADGSPHGVLDVRRLRLDASLLAYEFAAASGDSDELDRLGVKWANKLTEPYYGGVLGGALSLLVREIFEPLLMLLDEVRPDIPLRDKLRECRDDIARMTGGGGR